MDYKNINTFLKVAELESFSLASKELGYSKAAVTVQVKHLEEEMGVSLFTRVGRKSLLTEAGRRFIPYAEGIMSAHLEAEGFVNRDLRMMDGLRIGTTAGLATVCLTGVLHRFSDRDKKGQLRVRIAPSVQRLRDYLLQDDVDLALYLGDKLSSADFMLLWEKPETVVFAGKPLYAARDTENIRQGKLLMGARDSICTRWLEHYYAEHGIVSAPLVRCDEEMVLKQFAIEGFGAAFLPLYAIRDALKDHRLSIIDGNFPRLSMYIQLVCRKERYVSPEMETFKDMLHEAWEML